MQVGEVLYVEKALIPFVAGSKVDSNVSASDSSVM